MYLSTIQNVLMIIAVRILHLNSNIHVAVQSMSVLFWVLCLAPFCSHYFKKYFTRAIRFIFSLIITCYGFVIFDYTQVGYYGAFFLLLLLIYDFEKINNFIYIAILSIIPVICTSKMMYVVFLPVTLIYYLLFRKEMGRKKKCCVAMIGACSFMEGLLSVLLRHGVQSGHSLGTIQHVTLPVLINKVLYFAVQMFGIRLRCGITSINQLLENISISFLMIGILAFTTWQIYRKGTFVREAKFILVMFCLIIVQCAVMVLTTVDWHTVISWRQSLSRVSGLANHPTNIYAAVDTIFFVLLWVIYQYFKPHFKTLQEHLDFTECFVFRTLTLLFAAGITFFYINQHSGAKSYESANPLRSTVSDWKAYVSMLASDAFCIRTAAGEARGWFYCKNASVKSLGISRSASVDLSNVAELNEKSSIVLYVHKTAATNQIFDRYYYINIYDESDNLVLKMRQMNPDPERLFIAFYLEGGILNIGHVDFSYEDGSQAFVDDTIEIGYR